MIYPFLRRSGVILFESENNSVVFLRNSVISSTGRGKRRRKWGRIGVCHKEQL